MAKRVEHLRIEILVMSLGIVAQMLNPYRFLFLFFAVFAHAIFDVVVDDEV
jgi:hypothetical protein